MTGQLIHFEPDEVTEVLNQWTPKHPEGHEARDILLIDGDHKKIQRLAKLGEALVEGWKWAW